MAGYPRGAAPETILINNFSVTRIDLHLMHAACGTPRQQGVREISKRPVER
jgi:hypothetical protein